MSVALSLSDSYKEQRGKS